MNKLGMIYGELRRRKVINTFVLYILSCWVILQVSAIAFPIFGLTNDYYHWLLGIFIVFLPVVLTISWHYQFTSGGFIRIAPFAERRALNNIEPRADRRLSLKNKNNRVTEHHGWFIYAEAGPVEGLEYNITQPVILGRAIECEITLLRSHISRHHARLQVVENVLTVEDMGSSNGTYVNGARITGQQILHHGDELSFKDVIFRVKEYSSQVRNEALLNQTTVIEKI